MAHGGQVFRMRPRSMRELRRLEENLVAVMTEQEKRLISNKRERETGGKALHGGSNARLPLYWMHQGGDPKLARRRWSDLREGKMGFEKQ